MVSRRPEEKNEAVHFTPGLDGGQDKPLFLYACPRLRATRLKHMRGLDTDFLREMLGRLEEGDRFGLSPDRYAEIFPPGHHDTTAFAAGRRFAETHHCDMDYWRATNEVFFTKRRPA
jgi:hypothetical protein